MPKRALTLTATWNGEEIIVYDPSYRNYAAVLVNYDPTPWDSKVGFGASPEIAICDLIEQLYAAIL